MAIAFSAVPVVEQRAPANPVATKGNTAYTRKFRCVIPASTTVASLVLGKLPTGTLVQGIVVDTDTTLGATARLTLLTTDSTFMAAVAQTVVGGEQKTIAANKGVAVKSSSDELDLTLQLSAASSPASEVVIIVTLTLASFDENAGYATQNT